GMPTYGILAVTVPGSAWGWGEVLQRFGKKTFKEVLKPAIEYAENGFPVSERIASDWKLPKALPLKECCTALDPDSIATWYVDGKPPMQVNFSGILVLRRRSGSCKRVAVMHFIKGKLPRP